MIKAAQLWNTAIFSTDKKPFNTNFIGEKPVAVFHNKSLRTQKKSIHTIADPFLIVHNGILYLFVEEKKSYEKGKIRAYATENLFNWDDLGIVLEESFHLYYTFVFKNEDSF